MRVSGRVDTLVPLRSGASLALLDHTTSLARFLPHDDLALLREGRGSASNWRVPPYITPPGISLIPGTHDAYLLLDTTLLQIDTTNLHVVAHWSLNLRALGWPAAVLAAGSGRVYVVGQPRTLAPAAEVEALDSQGHSLHVVWQRSLGLTHAGLWLGSDGRELAVYVPDAHDVSGTVQLLRAANGSPVGTQFSLPTSPSGLDALQDVIYVNYSPDVRAVSLRNGAPLALAAGAAPLAVDPARGILAFLRGRRLAIAAARTLRPLAQLSFPDVTALAFAPNGNTLIAAQPGKVTHLALGSCRGG